MKTHITLFENNFFDFWLCINFLNLIMSIPVLQQSMVAKRVNSEDNLRVWIPDLSLSGYMIFGVPFPHLQTRVMIRVPNSKCYPEFKWVNAHKHVVSLAHGTDSINVSCLHPSLVWHFGNNVVAVDILSINMSTILYSYLFKSINMSTI